jgi:hypothetical protein
MNNSVRKEFDFAVEELIDIWNLAGDSLEEKREHLLVDLEELCLVSTCITLLEKWKNEKREV